MGTGGPTGEIVPLILIVRIGGQGFHGFTAAGERSPAPGAKRVPCRNVFIFRTGADALSFTDADGFFAALLPRRLFGRASLH